MSSDDQEPREKRSEGAAGSEDVSRAEIPAADGAEVGEADSAEGPKEPESASSETDQGEKPLSETAREPDAPEAESVATAAEPDADEPAGKATADAGEPAPDSGQGEGSDSTASETESTTQASYYDDPYGDDYDYASSESKSEATAVAEAAPAGASPPPPPPPSDGEDEFEEEEEGMVRMSFLEHLEELRTRIIRTLIGLTAAYLFCLLFAKRLFFLVTGPVQRAFEVLNEICSFPAPLHLVAITPPEQFHLIYLKVPLLAAVFVAAPWLVYQAWGFIAPGLYKRERRWAKPFIVSIAGLFILGGLFGYFVVLKFALTFLIGIGCDINIMPMISVSSYFSTFVMVELGLGVVFQMPVLIFFLTLLRIVSPSFLLENIRYAILIIFILAAVITPTPDVFNMILFAAPMILLFYVGIGASYLLVLKREKRKVPWVRIIIVAVLILLAVVAGVLYLMQSQFGYQFVDQFPWIVAPVGS